MWITTILAVTLLITFGVRTIEAQTPVWIESERPTSINTTPDISGWGFPDYLSNGSWLHVSIPANKVGAQTGSAGITISYKFTVVKAGTYHLWNRLGYERVRSPFTWQIDDFSPVEISPEMQTTDLMELQPWNELAWLNMGASTLSPGAHVLTIHIPGRPNGKGGWHKILYASDCFCICRREFHPHGKFPPGVWPQTAEDVAAHHNVFQLPVAQIHSGRSRVRLKGLWQITRSDEAEPSTVDAPITSLPRHPYWSAIPVPGDKNTLRPDLLFAHRLWYRTLLNVPAGLAGNSFYLVFPQNNLNTTVFVNGTYCGFNPNPFVRFHIDVSRAMHPGLNTLLVGIRDAWYGFETEPNNPSKLRDSFNLPIGFFHQGFQHLAYPIWNNPQSGILATPSLVCAGKVYTSNVFVMPLVSTKSLAVKTTIRNSSAISESGTITCSAFGTESRLAAVTLPSQKFSVPPHSSVNVALSGSWANPRLWSPQHPFMYSLQTTILINHHVVDRNNTIFGYRQWSIVGTNFLLNGEPFHGWQDNFSARNPAAWLAAYKMQHETMFRFWGTSWMGMTPDHALNLFDKSGVVVRRQGMLDGEAIGYMAIEDDPVLQKLTHSQINVELMRNWMRQVTAEVRGERNHPSVMIWSIENEFLYINCINLYGNLMNEFEAAITKTAQAVMHTDPTRPVMVDGGGACKQQTLPVCGNHYIDGKWTEYPDLAYQANVTGGGRGRWIWDEKRPRFVGEDYFMTGNHPGLSAVGGEIAETGKTGTLHATALIETMLQQGYRWAGYGAWDFYDGPGDTDGTEYNSFNSRAVFCREWNWTFGSGQNVTRRFGIFNDSESGSPITFRWRLYNASHLLREGYRLVKLMPGTSIKFNTAIQMPTAVVRTTLSLQLQLFVGSRQVFHDDKVLAVLPAIMHLTGLETLRQHSNSGLLVYDPIGGLSPLLKRWKLSYKPVVALNALPSSGRVLIIGSNALSSSPAYSNSLASWASKGRTVVVLEQQYPLEHSDIPANIATTANSGFIAFGQNYGSSLLSGLRDTDFFTWGPHNLVYRNAYLQPKAGTQSLIECGRLLKYSALLTVPIGKGRFVLSQLRLEHNIGVAPVRRLLFNILEFAFQAPQPARHTYLCATHQGELTQVMKELGVVARATTSPLDSLNGGNNGLAVIDATPENLGVLAANLQAVRDYTKNGGWVVLNGLTPNGLKSYNKLVGYQHIIRPFRQEKVLFSYPRNPLTAGMSAGDLAMYSSKRIFSWTAGNYVADDEFQYVVDTNDAAPFATFNNPFYDNIVNGFVSSDGWPLIVDVPVPKSGPVTVDMKLPAPRTVDAITWIGNTMYWPTTHITLQFDGKDPSSLGLNVPPDDLPHRYTFKPVTFTHMQLLVDGWSIVPRVNALVGIDNINLWVVPSPAYTKRVRPMVADGGMIEYPNGKGGIILCNLWLKPNEDVPLNAIKKRRLFGALLQNLHAQFADVGGSTIPAINYTPINLANAANAFTGPQGWFGDKAHSFEALPNGTQWMKGVEYSIYAFKTSPVPTCIIVGAQTARGVVATSPSVAIHRKTEALYFLQSASINALVQKGETIGQYVITYEDGQTVNVPLLAHVNIDGYIQPHLETLPNADTAWSHKWPDGKMAEAFTLKWINPRPTETIETARLVSAHDMPAGIALLALTAASARTARQN